MHATSVRYDRPQTLPQREANRLPRHRYRGDLPPNHRDLSGNHSRVQLLIGLSACVMTPKTTTNAPDKAHKDSQATYQRVQNA